MLVVTILMIMAWWIIILFFAFIIQLIPLKNYHKNITKVQIALSSVSIILGLFAYFYIKNNYSTGMFNGSKWDEGAARIFIGAFCWCFVGSLLRCYFDGKARRNKIETFILRAEEYKLVKQFDFTMGDYLYSPNVKSYCEFDRGIIAFTGGMPQKESDCRFTCRMIKDGIFECLSYELLSGEDNKLNFSKIKQIIFFIFTAIDLALIVIWISQLYLDIVSNLVEGLNYILFGSFCCNIFYGVKGILPKILFGFSILVILLGISCIFE